MHSAHCIVLIHESSGYREGKRKLELELNMLTFLDDYIRERNREKWGVAR